MKRWWIGGLSIAILGPLLWVLLGPSGDGSANGNRADRLPVPVPRTQVAALGRVEPRSEEMQIAAAMTGRLASVEVDAGDAIRRGQVLATLENADHQARVRSAEASLAIARASLDRLINGARQAERDQAEAEVREAEAVLALAEQELQRQQGLARRDLGSRQDLDRARSEQRIALARLARVRFQRELIESPARADEQAQAEAEVALAEARLAEARAVLDKSFVRSPVDGMVLRKLRHAGELVTEMLETPIVTVGDLSVLRVRAEVDEADIALVHLGQRAYVKADAYGERRFAGRVSRVGVLVGRKGLRSEQPAERLDTRVLEVLVDLDPGSDLPVGLRVDTYFVLDAQGPESNDRNGKRSKPD